jgi:carbamoylphosphate synthase small subunit
MKPGPKPRYKPPKPPKQSVSRHKPINWPQVKSLASLQCTQQEILAITNVDDKTLTKACLREQGKTWKEFVRDAMASGCAALRKKQFEVALQEGNPRMLVWLGKQYLGQFDRVETKAEVTVHPTEWLEQLEPEELEVLAQIKAKLGDGSED